MIRRLAITVCIVAVVIAAARRSAVEPVVDDPAPPTSAQTTTTAAVPQGLVLADTFTDNRNGWSLDGAAINGGALTVTFDDRPSGGTLPRVFAPNGITPLPSVRIDGTVRWTTPAAPALICMADSGRGGGYVFTITPNGHGVIRERAPGDDRQVHLAASYADPAQPEETPPAFRFDPGRDISMVAECKRTGESMELRLFVDGRLIAGTTDQSPAAPGLYQVAASLSGAAVDAEGFKPCTIEWHDVTVTQPA